MQKHEMTEEGRTILNSVGSKAKIYAALADLEKRQAICDRDRAILEKDVEDLKKDKEVALAWQMRLLLFIFPIFGGIFWIWSENSRLNTVIAQQAVYIEKMEVEINKNSQFVAEWPTGKLGVLPDDNVQNTKIDNLDYTIKDMQKQINKLFNIKKDKD